MKNSYSNIMPHNFNFKRTVKKKSLEFYGSFTTPNDPVTIRCNDPLFKSLYGDTIIYFMFSDSADRRCDKEGNSLRTDNLSKEFIFTAKRIMNGRDQYPR